jgi:hypothetical protein
MLLLMIIKQEIIKDIPCQNRDFLNFFSFDFQCEMEDDALKDHLLLCHFIRDHHILKKNDNALSLKYVVKLYTHLNLFCMDYELLFHL